MNDILETILDLINPNATKAELLIRARTFNNMCKKVDLSKLTEDERDELFLTFGDKFVEVVGVNNKR